MITNLFFLAALWSSMSEHFYIVISWWTKESPPEKLCLKRDWGTFKFNSRKNSVLAVRNSISFLVEAILLLKVSFFGYWNGVNMNLRFFGVILISGIWTLPVLFLHFKFTNYITHAVVLTSYAAIFATIFWQERSSYYSKWSYLANLYNEVLKAKPHLPKNALLKTEYHSYRRSLDVALAMDIVQMEMWSHDSYEQLVVKSLKEAHSYKYERNYKDDTELYNKAIQMTKKEVLADLHFLQKKYLAYEEAEHRTTVVNEAILKTGT